MKKLILFVVALCIISVSCAKSPEKDIQTIMTPVSTLRYIGQFKDSVSLYREYEDQIVIQKEHGESFELYSLDINSPRIRYEYAIKPQNKLLYSKQLDKERTLKVKQLGNGEENNHLILEGKSTSIIAKNIAFSDSALVATSPSQKYVLYCAADELLNRYGLYLHNLETMKTIQLLETVNEELLNDMEWNISWSANEAYIIVSNQLILNVSSGKLVRELNAENVLWSASGNKLAYIKSEKGYGRSISILDLSTTTAEEVFLANQGDYLPGYMAWNAIETNLAFVTASIGTAGNQESICPYKGIYSLDLRGKEAVRVDSILKLDPMLVEKLENLQYNSTGSVLSLTFANNLGCDLYFYNLNSANSGFALNIEYLHPENNESYVCSSGSRLYFVQGQSVMAIDESLNSKSIYQSQNAIGDIYIAMNGSSMIILEKSIDKIVFRQLINFADKSM